MLIDDLTEFFDVFDEFYTIYFLFQRKTEFRKLCDKLRNHLDLVLKQSTSPLTINLNNADTQQMNLDTRLVQLGKSFSIICVLGDERFSSGLLYVTCLPDIF